MDGRTHSSKNWRLRMPVAAWLCIYKDGLIITNWSTRATAVPAGSDHYCHTECPSVLPKTSKSNDNHCRPWLWSGRVDHWWLVSFNDYFYQINLGIMMYVCKTITWPDKIPICFCVYFGFYSQFFSVGYVRFKET